VGARDSEAKLSVKIEAAFADQEFVTVLSKPAFWEGRCRASGTLEGRATKGSRVRRAQRFLRRRHPRRVLQAVSEEVRESVGRVYPLPLSAEQAQSLAGAPGRPQMLDGVDLDQLAKTLLAPVRLITDRNGKGWRCTRPCVL